MDQWARLCEYWSKPEIEQKAIRMANARLAIKNQSSVGRAGKAGKEALLVRVVLNSCCEPKMVPTCVIKSLKPLGITFYVLQVFSKI